MSNDPCPWCGRQERTVQDVYDGFNDSQKAILHAMIGLLLQMTSEQRDVARFLINSAIEARAVANGL